MARGRSVLDNEVHFRAGAKRRLADSVSLLQGCDTLYLVPQIQEGSRTYLIHVEHWFHAASPLEGFSL
jgi:hypothetical protein